MFSNNSLKFESPNDDEKIKKINSLVLSKDENILEEGIDNDSGSLKKFSLKNVNLTDSQKKLFENQIENIILQKKINNNKYRKNIILKVFKCFEYIENFEFNKSKLKN